MSLLETYRQHAAERGALAIPPLPLSADLDGAPDLPARLWMAPPTRMDAEVLTGEGYYALFGKSGARMEIPGCSLCMGNQAQIRRGSTARSTSTRNFPNRLGVDTRVYLGSGGTVGGLRASRPHPDHGRVP